MQKNRISRLCNLRHHSKLSHLDMSSNDIEVILTETLPNALQVLSLCNNKIKEISDLSSNQSLLQLNMSANNIGIIESNNMPVMVEVMNISSNRLTRICNLSRQQHLKELDISQNNISRLDPLSFPLKIESINLSSNKITKLGDFSEHHKLKELDVSKNNISVIDPKKGVFPHRLKTFCLARNPRTILGQQLFKSKRSFQLIKSSLGDSDLLYMKQPPIEIFRQGYRAVQFYYKDIDLSQLVQNSRKRIVLLGPTEAGKSSLIESLMKGEAFLVNIKDRTQVIDIKHLNITADDILHIYDLGGHSIYNITRPLFISKESTIFIVHDVTKVGEEMDETVDILRQTLHQYPANDVHVILTHTDLLESNLVASNVNHIEEKIKSFLNQEIKNFTKLLPSQSDEALDTTIKLLKMFKQKQSEMMYYEISSKTFDGIERVQNFLKEVASKKRESVPESWVKFYSRISLHPERFLTLEETIDLYKEECESAAEPPVALESLDEFTSDDFNQSDDDSDKTSLNEFDDYTSQNDSDETFYGESDDYYDSEEDSFEREQQLSRGSSQSISEDEESFLSEYHIEAASPNANGNTNQDQSISHESPDSVASRALVAINYFRDTNLVLHYDKNPLLKDYVFHDIDFIVEIFKSVFHHDITQVIDYQSDEKLQTRFKELECETAVKRYQNEGLLCKKLLGYFWEQYNLSGADEGVFIEFMRSFNLCFNISQDNDLLYFPWFVKAQKCPEYLEKDCLMLFDKEHASVQLQCEFFNMIPLNVFEMVCVCLQRKATKESHYMGDRQAWKDGLVVSFGSVECVVNRSTKTSCINIYVRGKIQDAPQIWSIVDGLFKEISSILSEWYGVIKSIHIICGHCVIEGIVPPKCWHPDYVFPKAGTLVQPRVSCSKDSRSSLPASLVVSAFKDSKCKEADAIEDLSQYICSHWKSKNPPRSVPYLDCEETLDGSYMLAWGRQNRSGEDSVINFVVEYLDQENRWTQLDEAISGTSLKFQRFATEFKVAAKNKYGVGLFRNCKPTVDISDENLTERDREHMKENKEVFIQMSCLGKITMRLYSRKLLHDRVQENIIIQLNNGTNTEQVACVLMDSVTRMTYQQLYLFKKTLMEFGQPYLADLVPIRKRGTFAIYQDLTTEDDTTEEITADNQDLSRTMQINDTQHQPNTEVMDQTDMEATTVRTTTAELLELQQERDISHVHVTSEQQQIEPDLQDSVMHLYQPGMMDLLANRYQPHTTGESSIIPQTETGPDGMFSVQSDLDNRGEADPDEQILQMPTTSAQNKSMDRDERSAKRPRLSTDFPPSITGSRQPSYNLLEELSEEQKHHCPKERLFGSIVHGIQNIVSLGLNLGFKYKKVQEFQKTDPSSVVNQAIEMLVFWRGRKKSKRPTLERLVRALQKSWIAEESYREAIKDYFNDSDENMVTEDSSDD